MLDWIVRRIHYYNTEITIKLRHLCHIYIYIAQSLGALLKPEIPVARAIDRRGSVELFRTQ